MKDKGPVHPYYSTTTIADSAHTCNKLMLMLAMIPHSHLSIVILIFTGCVL